MKMTYYDDIIQENKCNMKKIPILRNNRCKQKDKSNYPPEFDIEGQPVTNR